MKRLKLIVVENDSDEQEFMREGFDETGLYEIIAFFRNGNELFEYFETEGHLLPDLILSDLNMPGKNGYDILDEIKEHERLLSIPVVITSTSFNKSAIEKCMRLGAFEYLVKPETFNEYKPFAKHLYEIITKKPINRSSS
jgi:CheY-like chemotaxis protein